MKMEIWRKSERELRAMGWYPTIWSIHNWSPREEERKKEEKGEGEREGAEGRGGEGTEGERTGEKRCLKRIAETFPKLMRDKTSQIQEA